jgi:hypothetical protein
VLDLDTTTERLDHQLAMLVRAAAGRSRAAHPHVNGGYRTPAPGLWLYGSTLKATAATPFGWYCAAAGASGVSTCEHAPWHSVPVRCSAIDVRPP